MLTACACFLAGTLPAQSAAGHTGSSPAPSRLLRARLLNATAPATSLPALALPPASIVEPGDLPVLPPTGPALKYPLPAPAPDGLAPSPPPLRSFAGLDRNATPNTGFPPDVSAAAGPDFIVQLLQTGAAILDKTGNIRLLSSLQTFFGQPANTDMANPRVAYDPYAGRWLAAATANRNLPTAQLLLLVSETDDPTGAWHAWAIDADDTDATWPDFPCLGFNKNWMVVSANLYPNGGGSATTSKIWAFRKSELYAGAALNFNFWTPENVFTLHPALTYDNTTDRLYLLAHFNGNFSGLGYLKQYHISGTETNPALSVATNVIINQPWSFTGPDAPQLGSPNRIQAGDARIQSPPVFRNGSLWAVQTAFLPANNPNHSAVQWWKIDALNASATQFGRIDAGTADVFYAFPSLTVNANEEVLLGFTRFSTTTYASSAYAYRNLSDPANTLRDPWVYKDGAASYHVPDASNRNRWGSYSSTTLDPNGSLWACTQFAAAPANTWGSWFAQLDPNGLSGTCAGNTVSSTCTGALSDGSGANDYANGMQCSWTVNPPGLNTLSLSFTAFDTEANADVLRVYDGLSPAAPLLGQFSGANMPGPLTALSGKLHLVFESDGAYTRPGWAASYACAPVEIPVAAFSGTPLSGNAPLAVQFTDQSTKFPTSWNWDFGDGGSATQKNPAHTYLNPGTYTVQLTASNAAGAHTATRTAYVTVLQPPPPPAAGFSASVACGQAPLAVQFTDQSTNVPTAWNWSFGNGASSSQPNPSYTYTQPGIYTVSLTVSNAGGSTTKTSTNFIVVVGPVSAQVQPQGPVCAGQAVTLSASGAASYQWAGPGLSSNAGATVMALPPAAGTYTYTVTGSSNNCAAQPQNLVVQVKPVPQVDASSSAISICAGDSVFLSAAGADTYVWSGAGLNATTGQEVTAIPILPGGYVYSVTGTSDGCSAAPVTVPLQVITLPVALAQVAPTSLCLGQSATLSATGAPAYTWSGPGLNTGTGATVVATPPAAGLYTYAVTGINGMCSGTADSVQVLVLEAPALSLAATADTFCLGETVTLTASGADTYAWSGPGLDTSAGPLVLATPLMPGPAGYLLTGTSGGCTSAPASLNLWVRPLPDVQVQASSTLLCAGQSAVLQATGADVFEWTGPWLDTLAGATATMTPLSAGVFTCLVTGTTDACSSTAELSVTLLDTLVLGVVLEQSGCPGPELAFEATVLNGGNLPEIQWYLNGQPAGSGGSFLLDSAQNGDQVFCAVAATDPLPCTQPLVLVSDTLTVDCIAVGTQNLPGLQTLRLEPNPNMGVFRVFFDMKQGGELRVAMYSALGERVLRRSLHLPAGETRVLFELPDPVPGVYWLVLEAAGRVQRLACWVGAQ
ncbi:MAG: PKD domain-containing protein [Saprospiraceae bacterium]|nr:PKD domain-containing protein [Saprospiraceae bacterium]